MKNNIILIVSFVFSITTYAQSINHLENGVTQYEQNYPDGMVSARYYFDANNQRTGLWQTYQQNGYLDCEIEYKNNIPDGIYKEYYEDICHAVVHYKDGVLHGNFEWRYWKDTSIVQAKGEYTNGNKYGRWSYQDLNKNTLIGVYTNTVPDSIWTLYNKEGVKVAEVTYVKGEALGDYTLYFSNGKLREKGAIKDGYFYGKSIIFDEDGNEKEVDRTDKKIRCPHPEDIYKRAEKSFVRVRYK